MAKKKKKKKVIKEMKKAKEEIKKIEKELKRDYILIISALIILAVLAVFIISIKYFQKDSNPLPATDKRTYNGFVFVEKAGFWHTEINFNNIPYELMFYYPPDETLNITTRRGLPNVFMNAKRIYISLDPKLSNEAVVAGVEMAKIMGNLFSKEVKTALTEEIEGSLYPKITCQNMSNSVSVIMLQAGNTTSITHEAGCVIIEGTSERELIRAADRLTFEILKIIS
ncbi:hypothetical protein JW930_00465 [Candidatus Woesearchaeota archaeon]|nr:hypothetical protein [Candidatus Woesearchaeota archaeon]